MFSCILSSRELSPAVSENDVRFQRRMENWDFSPSLMERHLQILRELGTCLASAGDLSGLLSCNSECLARGLGELLALRLGVKTELPTRFPSIEYVKLRWAGGQVGSYQICINLLSRHSGSSKENTLLV
jgi:hypothetical protein